MTTRGASATRTRCGAPAVSGAGRALDAACPRCLYRAARGAPAAPRAAPALSTLSETQAPLSHRRAGVAGEDEGITAAEEAALARFMPPKEGQGAGAGGQKSLAEMILARIRDNQQQRGLDALPE
jgi:hypothetical protein